MQQRHNIYAGLGAMIPGINQVDPLRTAGFAPHQLTQALGANPIIAAANPVTSVMQMMDAFRTRAIANQNARYLQQDFLTGRRERDELRGAAGQRAELLSAHNRVDELEAYMASTDFSRMSDQAKKNLERDINSAYDGVAKAESSLIDMPGGQRIINLANLNRAKRLQVGASRGNGRRGAARAAYSAGGIAGVTNRFSQKEETTALDLGQDFVDPQDPLNSPAQAGYDRPPIEGPTLTEEAERALGVDVQTDPTSPVEGPETGASPQYQSAGVDEDIFLSAASPNLPPAQTPEELAQGAPPAVDPLAITSDAGFDISTPPPSAAAAASAFAPLPARTMESRERDAQNMQFVDQILRDPTRMAGIVERYRAGGPDGLTVAERTALARRHRIDVPGAIDVGSTTRHPLVGRAMEAVGNFFTGLGRQPEQGRIMQEAIKSGDYSTLPTPELQQEARVLANYDRVKGNAYAHIAGNMRRARRPAEQLRAAYTARANEEPLAAYVPTPPQVPTPVSMAPLGPPYFPAGNIQPAPPGINIWQEQMRQQLLGGYYNYDPLQVGP